LGDCFDHERIAMTEKPQSGYHAIWGFVIGGLLGVLGALFWLPWSGREARAKLLVPLAEAKDALAVEVRRDPVVESLDRGRSIARSRQIHDADVPDLPTDR
jgi:hypothetical protein